MMAKKLRKIIFDGIFQTQHFFFSFSLLFHLIFSFWEKNWRGIIIFVWFYLLIKGGEILFRGDSHNWIIIITNFLDLTFFSQFFLYKKQFLWMMLYGNSKESGFFLS